mmetsp:Transcript_18133/g.25250  ORF Transcript_18133/g.25250 Transcript_18133/m.25250 type:complete len:97 (-) Transcript_18133:502-792(-)
MLASPIMQRAHRSKPSNWLSVTKSSSSFQHEYSRRNIRDDPVHTFDQTLTSHCAALLNAVMAGLHLLQVQDFEYLLRRKRFRKILLVSKNQQGCSG